MPALGFFLEVDYDSDAIQAAEAELVVGLATAKDLLAIDRFSGRRFFTVVAGYDSKLMPVGR